jgi:hypothetical protein
MSLDPVTGLIISGVMSLFGMSSAKKQQKKMDDRAAQQLAEAQSFQKEQQAILDEQMAAYMQVEFENPYAQIKNTYADMENTFEDLRVSTEAADFQMEQATQQRANILAGLRGAAGTSGIAGLAQALANQGVMQAKQVSADIAEQEARNELAVAQAAADQQRLVAQGEAARQLQVAEGERMRQEFEIGRESTLLGMAYQGAAAANMAVSGAIGQQMQVDLAGAQTQSSFYQQGANLAMQYAIGPPTYNITQGESE